MQKDSKISILLLENLSPYIEIMENFLLLFVMNTTDEWKGFLNSTMSLNSIINSRNNYPISLSSYQTFAYLAFFFLDNCLFFFYISALTTVYLLACISDKIWQKIWQKILVQIVKEFPTFWFILLLLNSLTIAILHRFMNCHCSSLTIWIKRSTYFIPHYFVSTKANALSFKSTL